MHRRSVLKLSTAAVAGSAWAERLWAQAGASAIVPFNRFTRMVHDFYERQIAVAVEVGLKRKAALNSRADAEAYVQLVREK
ncbi:MAG TPA: hypothetical protein VFG20_23465, partial [Planctomycetaceae bacterium]|nr:hypothetical protein [Planctomycetaceae bacterium]